MSKKLTDSDEQGIFDMVPTAVDFVSPIGIFELSAMTSVTTAMVGITVLESHGVLLTSKNSLTDGCILVPWAGIKKLRFRTSESLKADRAKQ